MIITNSILRKLKLPKSDSHKGENGRLLIIAGSRRFHGSLVYAVRIASKIVDLIYVLTTKSNQPVIAKLKVHTAEFIPVKELGSYLRYVDCVLIGPGMGVSKHTKKLVRQVLKSNVRAVLDADALNVMDSRLKKLLNKNHILTPHKKEFERLTEAPSPYPSHKGRGNSRGDSLPKGGEGKGGGRYPCTVVLKGKIDKIFSPNRITYFNKTGNQGMTKGGTGDVLAGLIAGLYCKNDAFLSAAAGVYLNGLAGDELYKKVGPFYNAEDLTQQIPLTLWNLLKIRNPKHKVWGINLL